MSHPTAVPRTFVRCDDGQQLFPCWLRLLNQMPITRVALFKSYLFDRQVLPLVTLCDGKVSGLTVLNEHRLDLDNPTVRSLLDELKAIVWEAALELESSDCQAVA